MKSPKHPLIVTIVLLLSIALLDVCLFLFLPDVRDMFEETEYDIPPTCTEDGYRMQLSIFGKPYPVGRFLALGHYHLAAVTPPGCEKEGYTTYTCIYCHERYTGQIIPATGHTWIDTVTLPTCTEGGITTHRCTTCGKLYRDTRTPPAGHSYRYEITPPTCTEQGYTTFACEVCGYSYRDKITAPYGHDYASFTVAPTCTTPGYTSRTCTRCGLSTVTDQKAATGHRYTVSTVNATCTQGGYTLHRCSVCGDNYITDITGALGHTYLTDIRPATTKTNGATVHTCSRCGDSYETNVFTYETVFNSRQGDGVGTLYEGVDLSYHNQDVDFAALKASGISFVILRVGTTNGKDSKFEEYYAAAKAAGLHVGAYMYSYATTTAAAQADANRTLGWIAGKQFDYPIFLDIEHESQKNLSKTTLTNIVLTYCNTMVDSGWYPGLYTNKTWMELIDMTKVRRNYDVWLASWIVTGENISDYSADYSMWQYSATGKVPGISTDVDLDACFRNYPAYMKKYGYNGY